MNYIAGNAQVIAAVPTPGLSVDVAGKAAGRRPFHRPARNDGLCRGNFLERTCGDAERLQEGLRAAF